MLLIVSAPGPLLVSVTRWPALVVFTVWLANVRLPLDSPTAGIELAPVPLRLTACGLPLPLSVIVTDALRVPVAVGVNVTLRVQFPPAATLVPQLFD